MSTNQLNTRQSISVDFEMVIKHLSDEEVKQLTKAHLDEGITECRWCFAVDLERIAGEEIATHFYADAFLIHLKCPRCGGEFTLYSTGWGEDYLEERILKLHPELEGRIDNELSKQIIDRVIYHGDC